MKWVINRDSKDKTAEAIPQVGDTFQDLANEVKLNPEELQKWLTWSCSRKPNGIEGFAPNQKVTQDVLDCCEFRVPNTVLISMGDSVNWNAVRGVDGRIFGSWVFQDMDRQLVPDVKKKRTNEKRHVIVDEGTTDRQMVDFLTDMSKKKELEQFYFFGHADGNIGIINTDGKNPNKGIPPARYTHYGIFRMVLVGCGSTVPGGARLDHIDGNGTQQHVKPTVSGNTAWRFNVSRQGKLFGYEICKVRFWNLKDDIQNYHGLTPVPGLNDQIDPSGVGTP